MSDFQFDLVSPERRLASVTASEVSIPGADGDMTVMGEHAPLIATLRPGILSVTHGGGTDEYVVSGGFVEVNGQSVNVLAERAVPKGEMTQDEFSDMVSQAREAYDTARAGDWQNEPGPVDDAAKLLADMVAMGDHIGLDAGGAPLP